MGMNWNVCLSSMTERIVEYCGFEMIFFLGTASTERYHWSCLKMVKHSCMGIKHQPFGEGVKTKVSVISGIYLCTHQLCCVILGKSAGRLVWEWMSMGRKFRPIQPRNCSWLRDVKWHPNGVHNDLARPSKLNVLQLYPTSGPLGIVCNNPKLLIVGDGWWALSSLGHHRISPKRIEMDRVLGKKPWFGPLLVLPTPKNGMFCPTQEPR